VAAALAINALIENHGRVSGGRSRRTKS